jgi:hypothetical protein
MELVRWWWNLLAAAEKPPKSRAVTKLEGAPSFSRNPKEVETKRMDSIVVALVKAKQ